MPRKNRRLTIILSAVFTLALILGPGPGAMLIDGSADAPAFLFGVPTLYLWTLLWFSVLSGCILVAAMTIWKKS
jgi:hypothetical protein